MSTKYLISSEIRKLAKNLNCRISSKAVIVVNGRVEDFLKKAAERAKTNRRKTIMPWDM